MPDRPRPRPRPRWPAWLRAGLLAPLLLAYTYLVAGVAGGALPAHRDWRPPAAGVTIWVENNGVHTGLVLPLVAAGVDWRDIMRPEHLRDPRLASDYLAVGWGDHDFFVETPTWADLSLATVAHAALGSDDTVVHVEHIRRPRAGADVKALVLRPEEYRRLAAFVRATVAVETDGSVAYRPGYAAFDVFYRGRGHYSALTTCNSWTGEALRRAGVPMGRWTPFPTTVMAWL